jgi:hypothetical protein
MEPLPMSHPHYLIAKYIPDLQRVEPRNIGIVVWTPEATEARFLAEKSSQTGDVDGRSIPGFVASHSAYRQWIAFWRGQVGRLDIVPATGGARVSRRSPEFLSALMAANRGNFVLAEGGHVLDSVELEQLPALADHLFRALVETSGPEEPRDPSLDELCNDLIRDSRLAGHPMFKPQYTVDCQVGAGAVEEFEFTYGLGNGVPYHLIQRLPLPKGKRLRQKYINDVAWKFDRVIQAKVIDGNSGSILIYPTDEQRTEDDVKRGIRVLESITNVLDLKEYDRARDTLVRLSSKTLP